MATAKKDKQTKKRTMRDFAPAKRKLIVKLYTAAPWGKKKAVLAKYNVPHSLVKFWVGRPDLLKE